MLWGAKTNTQEAECGGRDGRKTQASFQPVDLLRPEVHCCGARRIRSISSTSGTCVCVALHDEKKCRGSGYRS